KRYILNRVPTKTRAQRMGIVQTPSPEGMSADQKRKWRHHPSGRMINKNAIAARMNRLKKKEYVNGLENKVGSLSSENHILKQENVQLNKRVEELEDESRYLRAVLANESMLAQLFKAERCERHEIIFLTFPGVQQERRPRLCLA
uniref:CREB/ATF bZIP transcription factor n=1 Tax=Hucho hucho TaxID=62062 RepID=A0A4W5RS34_9TELE